MSDNSKKKKSNRGGKRAGAGRKLKYGEKTKVMRIPLDMVAEVTAFINNPQYLALPFFASKVPAGFPSPADDYMEGKLDLNRHLIKHPESSFFVRASGNSMINAGIFDGDLMIVDKSLDPLPGKIVIAAIDGDLTVKRYNLKNNKPYLFPENDSYCPIAIDEEKGVYIWGVVTNVIHQL